MSQKTHPEKTKTPPRTFLQRHFDMIAIVLALAALGFMAFAMQNRSNIFIWDLTLCSAPLLLIPMVVALTIWGWEAAGRLSRFLSHTVFDSGDDTLEKDEAVSTLFQRSDASIRLSLTSSDTDDAPILETQEVAQNKRL